MQQILPSGQTGSPHRAVLLTRGLMGKLITPSLHSSEGRSSPSLLILLSCCCEVLSLTVRAGAKFGPDISLPAPHEALKIRTASDSLHLSTGRRRLKEKGKLITAGIKSCSPGLFSFSHVSQTPSDVFNL